MSLCGSLNGIYFNKPIYRIQFTTHNQHIYFIVCILNVWNKSLFSTLTMLVSQYRFSNQFKIATQICIFFCNKCMPMDSINYQKWFRVWKSLMFLLIVVISTNINMLIMAGICAYNSSSFQLQCSLTHPYTFLPYCSFAGNQVQQYYSNKVLKICYIDYDSSENWLLGEN